MPIPPGIAMLSEINNRKIAQQSGFRNVRSLTILLTGIVRGIRPRIQYPSTTQEKAVRTNSHLRAALTSFAVNSNDLLLAFPRISPDFTRCTRGKIYPYIEPQEISATMLQPYRVEGTLA